MKHWYNNGKIVKYCEVCPEGFVPGRINKKLNLAEQKNIELIAALLNKISAENLIEFYKTHTVEETVTTFNTTEYILKRTLQQIGYNFSFKKASTLKGKKSPRTKESYINGGLKSAATQKQHWNEKTPEEKEAWAIKMSECHLNSPTFATAITAANKKYRNSLSEEEKAAQDKMRSESMKRYWASLSEEEKECLKVANNGKTYNCSNSTPNLAFEKLLLINNIDFEREYTLERKRFDFRIDNILIEINPTFTHNSTFTPFEYNTPLARNYHREKTELATKYNFRCIHLFDWEDQDKIIKLLSRKTTIIGANKCELKLVEKQEAINFLFENHVQNYAKDSIRYGLYYKDELVSIMTFHKPRYNKNYEYELIRYCSKYNIIGSAEKLFKHFIADYSPASIISYCDLSKFNGETYDKLNFKLLKKNNPSCHWYNIRTKEHYTDNLLRQQGFSRLIHHCDAKDDTELQTSDNKTLMIEAGFVEIYDCGQATYVWKKEN